MEKEDLEALYKVVLDRKNNCSEGSYIKRFIIFQKLYLYQL